MTTKSVTGAPSGAPTVPREHAFDQLRALAMLGGVLFHAALAYSPSLSPFWPTADYQNWAGMDTLIWLPHLIRMPLFFLVAGYFTALILARRGMGGLARQRVGRILVPLVIAWPLVHVGMTLNLEWAVTAVDHPSGFLLMAREWLVMLDAPRLPPRTGHLWFLYYLLLFSLLLWVVDSLEWNRWHCRRPGFGTAWVMLALPLILLPGFAMTTAPHPAPESLLPQLWALLVFGPFFAVGTALHGRLATLIPLQRWLWPGIAISLALYVVFLLLLDPSRAGSRSNGIGLAALEAMIAGWGTLACLLAGLRWLTRPNRIMRYLAGSAYWTYLLHLPVLFAMQFLLMDAALPWPAKFAASVLSTVLVCLLSYELIVRRTSLRHWVG